MEPPRIEYDVDGLLEANVAVDPFDQFAGWFQEAIEAGIPEANMMTLATVDVAGNPDARVVLLKGHGPAGFVFFTNYASGKGQQLADRPEATLVFLWQSLHRQVRVAGSVERVDVAESDRYFASRPRGSQLAARASDQSEVIASREVLRVRYQTEESRWAGQQVPRPETWGGYRVIPRRIEFWQGQVNRLHDRIVYRLTESGWVCQRLSP